MLDVLLPLRCAICTRPGRPLCTVCDTRLVRLVPPVCDRCGSPGPWPVRRCAECAGRRLGFATARAAILYDEHARLLVRAWKERGLRDLASVAADLVAAVVARPDSDAVTFVPGDRERGLKRGHSTPERLALELAARGQLPTEPFLVRLRATIPQRGLGLQDRRRNVAGAFGVATPPPPRVILVDDVYTTGSTASACATALRRAGVRRVDVVSLTRAVR